MVLQGKENARCGKVGKDMDYTMSEELCEMVFYGELTIDEANDLVIAFTPEIKNEEQGA